LRAEVPSVMPVPVMKASSSTPAGMARFARPCRSSRQTTPDAVIVMASAVPAYRSQRQHPRGHGGHGEYG
jgi:hypothetical protein